MNSTNIYSLMAPYK